MMNVFIVDDERLARAGIRRLLKDVTELEIIGEAENIEDAEKFILNNSVDLMLLDVCMPGGDGFELLEKLTRLPQLTIPQVIFTTAFDMYNSHASAANALAYLVKPIQREKLLAAIQCGLERNKVVSKKHCSIEIS